MPIDLIVLFAAISILILVHEFGHFLAARFFGIWVEEFGLGLPPKIFSKKIGETKYSINLLPMGGFVKLHGEEEAALTHSKLKKPNRAFYKKPWWMRSIVLTAGVLMNFLLALLIISFLYTRGVPTAEKVRIEEVNSNSPASVSGILKADILRKIDGIVIVEVDDVKKIVNKKLDQELILEIERITNDEKEVLTVKATPRKNPPAGEGALGVVLSQDLITKSYPIYTAPYYGLKATLNISYLLFKGIIGVFWDFISGFKVPKDVAGPIGMYQLYGEARKYGVNAILELTGLISLNLAVINLFPIPPLDGSRLFFVVGERLTGKKLKKEWEEKMYQISFLFLIALFLLISIQDIRRLFGL